MSISVQKVEGEPEWVGVYAREGLRRKDLYMISAREVSLIYGEGDNVIDVKFYPETGEIKVTTPNKKGLSVATENGNQSVTLRA